MSPSTVAEVFVRELGRTPRQVFRKWSPAPLAVASIGQVHAAELLSGERVAVKVQYPKIVEALAADLENFRLLDRFSTLLFNAQPPNVLYEELRDRLREECDYRCEANHLRRFREIFGGRDDLAFPLVIEPLSTQRVLTMSMARGEPLESFASSAPQSQRNAIAAVLWDATWEAIFRHGLYNTDPHPANFQVEGGRLVCLDFGRVKVFSSGFVDRWKRLVRAVFERDFINTRRGLIEMDIAPSSGRGFDFAYAAYALTVLYRPWLCEGTFAFDAARVRRLNAVMFGAENPNRAQTRFGSDMVFFHQLMLGLNGLMARLSAQIGCRRPLLDLLYRADEVRPTAFTQGEIDALDAVHAA
jgi:predicted unusual protein kinase regulating ubiquinone biosynthesis (AarF/ABC1/UbiB family)